MSSAQVVCPDLPLPVLRGANHEGLAPRLVVNAWRADPGRDCSLFGSRRGRKLHQRKCASCFVAALGGMGSSCHAYHVTAVNIRALTSSFLPLSPTPTS